ncbi:hypothetical protein BV898_15395 [Hypsibius exemplaris]|uniref:GDNF/GAS1 domain-containing protein n=1 Tax=Hypsibius exemplaris TaxID=2072580 RepID=A0A9X6NAX0_HYPEX|nr:hypothetical protein BV898_15395 [Hypsibius exemplaris]
MVGRARGDGSSMVVVRMRNYLFLTVWMGVVGYDGGGGRKLSMVSAADPETVTACKEAQNECQISHNCGLQYHSVLIRCQPNPETPNGTCTESCRTSLRNLERGTKEGRLFVHCDCPGTNVQDLIYCQNHNSLFSCLPKDDPPNPSEDAPATACNDARRSCESDWICREALHYYEVVCERFFRDSSPDECPSGQCLDSLRILKRQQYAKALNGCLCDDVTASPRTVYCFQVDAIPGCQPILVSNTGRPFVSVSVQRSVGSALVTRPRLANRRYSARPTVQPSLSVQPSNCRCWSDRRCRSNRPTVFVGPTVVVGPTVQPSLRV